ncbi:general transcription factor 3C polypeptide 6 [Lampris incognitus]|uniref:general transcription factor 3C polypeptide 6 n=1 Tax=Lampris incognitus TaxID=2546036 RepID=UPI0024B51E00|nr:general transcription factor 3C polypeptide 6 [Lampris incognitus]XP_056137135.1 general transcription factor 3C polypeptide 6 [Lampris incognitus]
MEDEWEEEEQLVVAELSGVINNEFLSSCRGTCKILEIDSEKPMMQVGPYVFVGEYEDALGTCVLFEESPPSGETACPDLKYKCHTVKKLMMQRTFLTDKKEEETNTGGSGTAGQKDTSHSSPDPNDVNRQGETREQTTSEDQQGDAEEMTVG